MCENKVNFEQEARRVGDKEVVFHEQDILFDVENISYVSNS